MLTRLIVASYAWLVEVALWLALTLAGVVGYHVAVPMLHTAGGIPTNELAWRFLGALLCSVIAFLVLAVFVGPLLLLVDIRQAVRSIEERLERGAPGPDIRFSPPRIREEPTL